MNHPKKNRNLFTIHAVACAAGLLFIATFWSSSLISEFFYGHEQVRMVKQAIVYALMVFVPIMAVGGITNKKLQLPRSLMPKIALNGLLVMLPCAVWLNWMAQNNRFDALFYSIQAVELVAGAANLVMIVWHLRRLKSLCSSFRSNH